MITVIDPKKHAPAGPPGQAPGGQSAFEYRVFVTGGSVLEGAEPLFQGRFWSDLAGVTRPAACVYSVLEPNPRPDRRTRYRMAADLLRQWMQEPGGDDERTLRALDGMADPGMSCREEGE
ncbi:MAG: hypothetical protein HYZ53_04920 [Planctomycetes bacterium]|nr:hypothetical protein [Planctomycetota bacterium]